MNCVNSRAARVAAQVKDAYPPCPARACTLALGRATQCCLPQVEAGTLKHAHATRRSRRRGAAPPCDGAGLNDKGLRPAVGVLLWIVRTTSFGKSSARTALHVLLTEPARQSLDQERLGTIDSHSRAPRPRRRAPREAPSSEGCPTSFSARWVRALLEDAEAEASSSTAADSLADRLLLLLLDPPVVGVPCSVVGYIVRRRAAR